MDKRYIKSRSGIYLITIFVILFQLCLFTACSSEESGNTGNSEVSTIPKTEPVEISISFAGDIMAHSPQIASAKTNDGYDFGESFKYVKKYIQKSDLALCNLETSFAGKPYTGYPMFSAPDELADNIRETGFDVVTTANNHTFDKGLDGLKRTLKVLHKADLLTVGTKLGEGDKDYLITEVKGIKIGVVAATYETPKSGGSNTLNGILLGEEGSKLISSYSTEEMDKDLNKIKASVGDARKEGADVVIAYFHWGAEYDTEPNETEINIAKEFADFGVDMIFASHPHVLQKREILKTETDEGIREVPVFYSMGNFISNQRVDSLGSRYVEQGIIAQVKVIYDKDKRMISSLETGYIPTWVDKYYSNGRNKFAIIPLDDSYENNETLTESNHLYKAEEAYSDIQKLLGTPAGIFRD